MILCDICDLTYVEHPRGFRQHSDVLAREQAINQIKSRIGTNYGARNEAIAPQAHGTRQTYMRHLRRHERPCLACKQANTDYSKRKRNG